jgi:uncharacterized coiled-coil protein SlyX
MSASAQDDHLIRLETAVAHLEHDFERLHGVALELQTELRQLTHRLTRLERRLESLEAPPEILSPDDERPPHY